MTATAQKFKLKVISSSVRPGRKGPIIAGWMTGIADAYGSFEVELVDLGALNLPMMNEKEHPRLQQYEHQHSKDWSAKIDEADAFIFVTAEYDFGYPAPLRNALEYLYNEWTYKPAGLVSYGGISAGTRAWNSLKGDLCSFKMVPVMDSVNIPQFGQFIKDGLLEPNESMLRGANALLKELLRWTKVLKAMREEAQQKD